jgi:hypothetical protein
VLAGITATRSLAEQTVRAIAQCAPPLKTSITTLRSEK